MAVNFLQLALKKVKDTATNLGYNISQGVAQVASNPGLNNVANFIQEGKQRVANVPASQYFLPTANTPFKPYVQETAQGALNTAQSALKTTIPYMAYRYATGNPIQPMEYLQNAVNVPLGALNTMYRTSNIAPFLGASFGAIKGVRETGTTQGALQGAYRGIAEQPFVGEAVTSNPKLANTLNLAAIPVTMLMGGIKSKGNISALDKGAVLENQDAKQAVRLLKEYEQTKNMSIDWLTQARDILVNKLKIKPKDFSKLSNEDILNQLQVSVTRNQTYAYGTLGTNLVGKNATQQSGTPTPYTVRNNILEDYNFKKVPDVKPGKFVYSMVDENAFFEVKAIKGENAIIQQVDNLRGRNPKELVYEVPIKQLSADYIEMKPSVMKKSIDDARRMFTEKPTSVPQQSLYDTDKIFSFVTKNKDIVDAVDKTGVYKMHTKDGRVVVIGTRGGVQRLQSALGNDVTDVVYVNIGRGKSGNAKSGEARLIYDTQDDLIKMKQILSGKTSQPVETWDHIPQGAKISEDGTKFVYKEKTYPVPGQNVAQGGLSVPPIKTAEVKVNSEGKVKIVKKPLKIPGFQSAGEIATTELPKIKSTQAEAKSMGGRQPSGSGSPPSSVSVADSDLISKLTQALKAAEPLRGTQEELYSKARGQKLAKLMSAREKMGGEKGYFQELGALKGELPKVQYESIRNQFDQPSVDRLFNMVKENKVLDDWDKVNAQVGLAKILGKEGGGVPTKGEIEKLYEVFGKDFTEALLSKRPLFAKLGDLALQAYNLPRSMMAGVADFSGTLMQNALLAYRHPIITAKNFAQQLKFFASEDAFKMSQQEIGTRPNADLYKQAKLSLTDTGPLITKREEQFMSSLAEKIPGYGKLIHATGRAYTGFLNRMRADVFDQMVDGYRQTGGDITPAYLKSVGEFVNVATGRGSLGTLERVAPVLGQGLFSARKLMATVQTINPMFYINAHPQVRKEALYTMLSFLGGATAITQLSKLAGAEVGDDPTSTDFGKIKFGNTRFNLYGPYQQIAVLFSRLWKGYATSSTTGKKLMLGDESNPYAPNRVDLITRYFESKEHPTLSLIIAALKGQNSIGQPFNAPVEVLNRFIPMVLADGYDLYKEHGPKGLLGLIPAILGISAQTYGSQVPTIKTTPAGKQTIKLNPVGGLSEDIINKVTGNPVSNIPQDQWAGIVSQKTQEQQATNQKAELKQQLQAGKVPDQQAQDLETAKLIFQYSDKPTETFGNTFLYKTDSGSVDTIDMNWTPPELVKTGDEVTDASFLSDWKGKITARQKELKVLFDKGAIDQGQLISEMNKLDQLKKSKTVKSGGSKKLSIKKVSPSKVTKVKSPKVKALASQLSKNVRIRTKNLKLRSKL